MQPGGVYFMYVANKFDRTLLLKLEILQTNAPGRLAKIKLNSINQ